MPHVLYYFHDDLEESHPNAFEIPGQSSSNITFAKFLSHWPLKSPAADRLRFRFKIEDPSSDYAWLDVSSPDEVLPTYKGNLITVRILQLDKLDDGKAMLKRRQVQLKSKGELDVKGKLPNFLQFKGFQWNKTDQQSQSHQQPPQQQQLQQQQQQRPPQAPYADAAPTSSSSAAPKAANPTNAAASPKAAASSPTSASPPALKLAPPKPAPVEVDLMGSPSTTYQTPAAAAAAVLKPAPVPPPVAEVKLDRAELVAAKAARVDDAVKKGLEFKRDQDDKRNLEAEQFDAARTKNDARLSLWSHASKDQKRNVRSLLSSLHTVTWPGCRWKEIGLGDLLEPKQVKFQYRKAMLIVHTDKTVEDTVEVRFIAKRCFEAINEAYEEFLTKESVN